MSTNPSTIIDLDPLDRRTDLTGLVGDATKLNRMQELVAVALCEEDVIDHDDVALLHELTWTTGLYLRRVGELVQGAK